MPPESADATALRIRQLEQAILNKVDQRLYETERDSQRRDIGNLEDDIDRLVDDVKSIREDQRKILEAQLAETRRTTLTVAGIVVSVLVSVATMAITIAIATGAIGGTP